MLWCVSYPALFVPSAEIHHVRDEDSENVCVCMCLDGCKWQGKYAVDMCCVQEDKHAIDDAMYEQAVGSVCMQRHLD